MYGKFKNSTFIRKRKTFLTPQTEFLDFHRDELVTLINSNYHGPNPIDDVFVFNEKGERKLNPYLSLIHDIKAFATISDGDPEVSVNYRVTDAMNDPKFEPTLDNLAKEREHAVNYLKVKFGRSGTYKIATKYIQECPELVTM